MRTEQIKQSLKLLYTLWQVCTESFSASKLRQARATQLLQYVVSKGGWNQRNCVLSKNLKYINFEAGGRILSDEPQEVKSSFHIKEVIC
jgi:hypothetical protein